MKKILIGIMLLIGSISSLGGEYKPWNYVDDKIVEENTNVVKTYPRGSQWAYMESFYIEDLIVQLNQLIDNGGVIHDVKFLTPYKTSLITMVVCYSIPNKIDTK